ncbi:MAG TPA: EpsG family protein [Terriglobales bacterium]|nr:EpsG family protein [Terriglobales bacterium]
MRFGQSTLAWGSTAAILALLIGLRVEVGGDWFRYLEYLVAARTSSFLEVLQGKDPGYQALNWIGVHLGGGILWVNLAGGAIFAIGLTAFCRTLPRPWLALTVAIPYLVIVVGMGYSRQAIALGLLMLGLVNLSRGEVFRFAFWIVLGATFHKSAVLMLPVAALSYSKRRLWTGAWIAAVTAAAYVLLLQESAESLYVNYVEAKIESEGALVRVLMTSIPAAIFLLWRRRFAFAGNEESLWRWLSIFSLLLLAALLVSSASAAIDRVALYLLPLQLAVFSHLPGAFGRSRTSSLLWCIAVISYYFMVQFIWLNFAAHAYHWLPYRFYLLENLF